MPPGSYNEWGFLATRAAVLQGGGIITQNLQGKKQVIQVLNFDQGAKAPHRGPQSLTHDAHFTDARIGHPGFSVFFLKPRKTLIDIANFADILAECKESRFVGQPIIKALVQNLKSIELRGAFGKAGRDGVQVVDRRRRKAVQTPIVEHMMHALHAAAQIQQIFGGIPNTGVVVVMKVVLVSDPKTASQGLHQVPPQGFAFGL